MKLAPKMGRKRLPPKTEFNPSWAGLDVLAPEMADKLVKLGAPRAWVEKNLEFMFYCLIHRDGLSVSTRRRAIERYNEAARRHRLKCMKGSARDEYRCIARGERFAELFAKHGTAFLKLLLFLEDQLSKPTPQAEIAAFLAGSPRWADISQDDLREMFPKPKAKPKDGPPLKDFVFTEKTIEKARARVRKSSAFNFPRKTG